MVDSSSMWIVAPEVGLDKAVIVVDELGFSFTLSGEDLPIDGKIDDGV